MSETILPETDEQQLRQQIQERQQQRIMEAGSQIDAILTKYRLTLAVFALSPTQHIPLPLADVLPAGWGVQVQPVPMD